MIIPSEIQEFDKDNFKLLSFYNENFVFVGELLITKNEIWNVEIFPEFRGKRYCEKMFREYFEETKYSSYVLVVAKDNFSAQKAYERMGFKYVENTMEEDFSENNGYLQMEISI